MYNPATQVQILRDVNLGFYYLKKITVGASPTVFLSKKIIWRHRNTDFGLNPLSGTPDLE
jgi:hypothetical protein